MRKSTLSLDKELVISENDASEIDGGWLPGLVFLPFVWRIQPGDIIPLSAEGDPDGPTGGGGKEEQGEN